MLAGAPTGLYGHVEENRKRSIPLFAGFIVAIELMAFVTLLGLTMLYDYRHSPLVSRREPEQRRDPPRRSRPGARQAARRAVGNLPQDA